MATHNVLLTGATGFIGSQLLEALLKAGHAVSIVVRKQSDTHRIAHILGNPNVRVYSDEVSDLRRAFIEKKIAAVVHLAGKYIKAHTKAEEVDDMMRSNVVFPAVLLDLMREYGVQKIVNTGSFFEYELTSHEPLTETSSLKPFNLYARTKSLFDEVAKDYTVNFGFSCVTLRLFAVYGPGDNEKLMAFLIKNFLTKKQIALTKSEQQWNFTFVHDIVEAYVKAVEYSVTMPAGYEVFNIGSTKAVSVKDVVQTLEHELAVSGLVSYDKPYLSDEIFYANCDGVKAAQKLGWTAKTSLVEGLKQTVAFYKK